MAVTIANSLASKGINSHLCSTRLEGSLKKNIKPDVHYFFLNKKTTFDIKAVFKLKNYVKKNKITHIHAHTTSYFLAFLVKLIQPSVKIIWHDHYGNSEYLHERSNIPLKLISKYFLAIISVNEQLQHWAIQSLKFKNAFCLYNYAVKSVENKSPIQLKGIEGKRIICMANFRKQKDHFNLVSAFKLIHEKYSDWSLHLVGKEFDDDYTEKVKDFIKSENLQVCIYRYGSVENSATLLQQADIGVLSSASEGLPVALLEYGLYQLPVVVTNVGDCHKVVTHNISGMLVASKNPHELANAIETLIHSKDKRSTFGEALYKKVRTNFSEEAYINKLLQIYHCE